MQPLFGTDDVHDEVGTAAWVLASLLSAVAVVAACAVCAGSKTDSTEADAGVMGTEVPSVANPSQSPVLVRCLMFWGWGGHSPVTLLSASAWFAFVAHQSS